MKAFGYSTGTLGSPRQPPDGRDAGLRARAVARTLQVGIPVRGGRRDDQSALERRRAGLSDQADVRFRCKDGNPIWTIMAARPIHDADGEFRGVLDLFADITQRKADEAQIQRLNVGLERRVADRTVELGVANEALSDGERRFRAIFDSAFQFIGLLSPEGVTLEANRTALEFMSLSRDAVVGQPFWETPWWTHCADAQQRVRQAIRSAVQGELCRFEADHHGADGATVTVDFSLKPIKDDAGRVVLLIAEGRAITEQKQAAEALRVSEERFRGAFDSAAVGVALITVDGRWLQVNDSLCKILGHSQGELLGRYFHEFTDPADHESDLELNRRFLSGELGAYRMERRYVHREGQTVWIMANARLVRDAEGVPLHFVAS